MKKFIKKKVSNKNKNEINIQIGDEIHVFITVEKLRMYQIQFALA